MDFPGYLFVGKKEVFGWSMYDFANTIFSALFVTIYFPLLVVLKGGNAFHVGLVISLSLFFSGLLVPLIGALIDLTHQKKKFLFIFTILCCTFTVLAGFFNLFFVLLFGMLANLFYHICLDVYDSLLVNVSDKKNIGRISGIGTAVGYGGTILSVIVAYIIGYFYGYESNEGIFAVLVSVSLLYLIFSMPTFLLVKHKKPKKLDFGHLKSALKRVWETIRGLKKYRKVWIFLLSSFLYADAANTTIIFLFLYARDQLGFSVNMFLPLYLLMAVAAGLGALLFGMMSDRYGHRFTLRIVLMSWVLVILSLYFSRSVVVFFIVGLLGGALLGAIWTITRPILVELAPKHKVAELFGYQGLTEKFSGIIGPFLFGLVATFVGFKPALFVVLILFLGGFFVLGLVK